MKNSTFSLIRSNPSSDFEIIKPTNFKTIDYNLILAQNIDRELNPIQLVCIVCTDSVGHYTEKNLTIHIMDQNDNEPTFLETIYYLEIEENLSKGSQLRQRPTSSNLANTKKQSTNPWLTVTDADTGPNAIVTFGILQDGLNSSQFVINPVTSIITTNDIFDREIKDKYFLKVLAVDKGNPPLTGTANIEVNI